MKRAKQLNKNFKCSMKSLLQIKIYTEICKNTRKCTKISLTKSNNKG